MNFRRGTFAAAISVMALLSALAATAAIAKPVTRKPVTRIVYVGPPPNTASIARHYLSKAFITTFNPDVNMFFTPRTVIAAGDTVSFVIRGFHTVDLPGRGGQDQPLIIPGPTVGNELDAAGNPFWFDGKVPSLGFNPALFTRSKGTTYNGRTRLDSGLPVGNGAPKPFNVKFTKPGVYKFFCDVHFNMVGYIVVKPKGASIPSAAAVAAAQTRELIVDLKAAKKTAATKLPPNTVSIGQSSPTGLELFTMFPQTLTVTAGTKVTFVMSKYSGETHTITFGPQAYLDNLSASFNGPAPAPAAIYPSDPPGTITETPTSHGNGFANTGALDNDPSTPLPASATIMFPTPGTYHFQCLIHPMMRGTIIVK